MTVLADKLLDTLRQHGGWMNRRAWARAIGRPQTLTPYDLQLIEKMAADGLIEVEQHQAGPVRFEWVYRAKKG